MSKSGVARLAVGMFGFAMLWLFLCPRPAAADSFVTYSFTGTAGDCSSTSPVYQITICGSLPAASIVTATYAIDFGLHHDSLVGWEFSTPFGAISSTNCPGDEFDPGDGNGRLQFCSRSPDIFVELNFANMTFGPEGYGPITNGAISISYGPSPDAGVSLSLLSGSASPVATPEPASLLLLGAGLLCFVPLIRRHYRHS